MSWLFIPAAAAALAWLHLTLLHGRFWRCSERLPPRPVDDSPRPAVVAVIPARNEVDAIGATIRSLLDQRYGGALSIVVVDDGSSDGTAKAAGGAGAGAPNLTVLAGQPLPPGWAGKLWAQQQGLAEAARREPAAAYVLLSDADIAHADDAVERLVDKAEREALDLVSLMVRLNCDSAWERLLIPPFIFFFQKLYPFPRANDPASRTAAAAGGCVLVRRAALTRIGGLSAIRTALIDDCTLARAVKRSGGRIWVGLAESSRSLRRYAQLRPIWDMVSRSAYTQLRRSPLLLAGTVLGMILLYLAPPALLLSAPWHGDWAAAAAAGFAWLLMALVFSPTLRLYGQPPWMAVTLPLAAMLYTAMTVDSALRHWRGRGGQWKGRHYTDLRGESAEAQS